MLIHKPDNAYELTKFTELKALMHSFIEGKFPLIAILGHSGLSKTYTIEHEVKNKACCFISGRVSPIKLYEELYYYRDKPIILDDSDNIMSQPLCREYVKNLTDTKRYRKLTYTTKTKMLDVPSSFITSSPVCIIANNWKEKDPIYQAIESRAEFAFFGPSWGEVYNYVGEWFWDQEIYDYLYENLENLKEPDIRLLIKAHKRKLAGNENLPWQKLISSHLEDEAGILVRDLLRNENYNSNEDRIAEFIDFTGLSRATFYRYASKIGDNINKDKPPRIILKYNKPPDEDKPEQPAKEGLLNSIKGLFGNKG